MGADKLLDYCTSQYGMIVVPIELISERGLDASAAEAYIDRGALTRAECERVDEMMRKYSERATKLGRASRKWFPPRAQHLCLVTNGVKTRPYFQPFHASSWLLYRDDIVEETSSLEFGIFLLFQAERQYLQQQIGASLLTNLPYLLILNDEQLEDFCAGCRRSRRPDAEGYRALADAMPTIRRLHHEQFRRPAVAVPGASTLENGLIADPSQRRELDVLHGRWMHAVESAIAAHRRSTRPAGPAAGSALLKWLDSAAPEVLLTGTGGQVIWHGPGSGSEQLGQLAGRMSPDAEASIIEDLTVIDGRSRRVLDAFTAPDELAPPAPWMTEGGLSYIHAEYKRIAYSLTGDPDRLWQVAPPYERLMLAARTVHEWGHQAAESGWVRVDPLRKDERRQQERALIECLDRIVGELPTVMKPALIAGLGSQGIDDQTPGEVLFRGLMHRIDDYMANLLARQFLNSEEMDTYIRNNVGSRLLDYASDQSLTHLLRVAYEYQYLGLSSIDDPRCWFLGSTWFESLFVDSGLVGMDRFFELTRCIADLCDCYAIDTDKVRIDSSAL